MHVSGSPSRITSLARTAGRLAAPALLALAGLTCRDRSPTGPGIPLPARLAVAPAFQQTAPDGPTIALSRARAVLYTNDTPKDSVVVIASFQGDSAIVQFEVPVTGSSELMNVHIALLDAAGDTIFAGDSSVRVFPTGSPSAPTEPATVPVTIVRPDAKVTNLRVEPRDTTVSSLDSLVMRVVGKDAQGNAIPTPVGWTSRDATVATIEKDGGKLKADLRQKSVWVVATTIVGVKDSTRVFVNAPVASLALAADSIAVPRDDSARVAVQHFDIDRTVLAGRATSWASSDPTVATVDASGLITGRKARSTALIIATTNGKADTTKVAVGPKPVATVALGRDTLALLVGQTASMTAAAIDAQGAVNPDHPLSWSSADTTIARASATAGSLTSVDVAGVAVGQVLVQATAGGVSKSLVVVVSPVPVAKAVVSPKTGTVVEGDTLRLTAATMDSAGGTLTGRAILWSSLDPQHATVDGAGLVYGVLAGTARIVGTSGAGADTATITVTPAINGMTLLPRADTLKSLGDTLQLLATATANGQPKSATFAWVSRDTTIAAVDAQGRAIARQPGQTWLVASTVGLPFADSVVVTVRQSPASIQLAPGSAPLTALGQTATFSATAVDARGHAIGDLSMLAWSSGDPTVATVGGAGASGVATATGNGSTAITASANGVSASATITVAQALHALLATPVGATIATGQSITLLAQASDANGSPMQGVQVVWTSTNPQVAIVDPNTGLVTGASAGTARISATSGSVTSNDVVITVGGGKFLFTVDSILTGQGTAATVTLALASPPAGNLSVSIDGGDSDEPVFATPSRFTFTPSSYAIQISISGQQLGRALLQARAESQGAITYEPDTLIVNVVPGAQLRKPIVVAVGDTAETQVILSSAVGAAGDTVNFTSASTNVAVGVGLRVPPSHIGATAKIVGVAPGQTVITPVIGGMQGLPQTVTVVAKSMRLVRGDTVSDWQNTYVPGPPVTRLTIGVGQVDTLRHFLQLGARAGQSLSVAMTTQHGHLGVESPVVIANDTAHRTFSFRGLSAGSDVLSASAPGWPTLNIPVEVTPPRFLAPATRRMRASSTLALSNCHTVYDLRDTRFDLVQVADTFGVPHLPGPDARVRVRSRDFGVIYVDTTVALYAGPDNCGTPAVAFVSQAVTATDSAWIVFDAPWDPSHKADSTLFIVEVPVARFSEWNGQDIDSLRTIGRGQMLQRSAWSAYLDLGEWGWPVVRNAPSFIMGLDGGTSLAADTTYLVGRIGTGYQTSLRPGSNGLAWIGSTWDIHAKRQTPSGQYWLYSRSPSFLSDSVRIRVAPPRFYIGQRAVTLGQGAKWTGLAVFLSDSAALADNRFYSYNHVAGDTIQLKVTSLDPSVATVDFANPIIPKGMNFVLDTVRAVGAGTTKIIVEEVSGLYPPDTITVTVNGQKVNVYSYPFVGLGQRLDVYIQAPSPVTGAPVRVYFQDRSSSGRFLAGQSGIDSIDIAVGQQSVIYRAKIDSALAKRGVLPLTVTAPGVDTTLNIRVTRPKLMAYTAVSYADDPNRSTAFAGTTHQYPMQVYAMDSVGAGHAPVWPLGVRLRSTDPTVIAVDTVIRIDTLNYIGHTAQNHLRFLRVGSASIIAEDTTAGSAYTPDTILIHVRPPVSNGVIYFELDDPEETDGIVRVAMKQHLDYREPRVCRRYDSYGAGTDTVLLTSSDKRALALRPNGADTMTVFLSNGNCHYFNVYGRDTTGVVQVKATIRGSDVASTPVHVFKGALWLDHDGLYEPIYATNRSGRHWMEAALYNWTDYANYYEPEATDSIRLRFTLVNGPNGTAGDTSLAVLVKDYHVTNPARVDTASTEIEPNDDYSDDVYLYTKGKAGTVYVRIEDKSTAYSALKPLVVPLTLLPSPLNLQPSSGTVGVGQRLKMTVALPYWVTSGDSAIVRLKVIQGASSVTLPDSVIIKTRGVITSAETFDVAVSPQALEGTTVRVVAERWDPALDYVPDTATFTITKPTVGFIHHLVPLRVDSAVVSWFSFYTLDAMGRRHDITSDSIQFTVTVADPAIATFYKGSVDEAVDTATVLKNADNTSVAIRGLEAGTTSITLSAPGYAPVTVPVTVVFPTNATVNLQTGAAGGPAYVLDRDPVDVGLGAPHSNGPTVTINNQTGVAHALAWVGGTPSGVPATFTLPSTGSVQIAYFKLAGTYQWTCTTQGHSHGGTIKVH